MAVATRRKAGGVSAEKPAPMGATPGAPAHGDFVYNGGPVIKFPQVYATFWGPNWSDATHQAQAARLVQYIEDMLASQWMNIMSQYGAGAGANWGMFVETSFIHTVPSTLTDAEIHTVLQAAFDNGTIPGPPPGNESQCVIIFLDETVDVDDSSLGIKMCDPSGDNAFGYHFFFQTRQGPECYYAVIPSLDDTCIRNTCPQGCSLNLQETQEQRRTQVTSHEFGEMVTDPLFPKGWFGPSSDENGDICNGETATITVAGRTWNVQRIYSKADDIRTNGATVCLDSSPSPIPALAGGPPIPSAHVWHHNDLSKAGLGPSVSGEPNGYVFVNQGTQHVVARGPSNHIHELWWDGAWHDNDLSAATGAPQAAGDPFGYVFKGQDTQHVIYRGVDHHIHELWWNGTWHHNDLTAAAGAPVAAGDPSGYVFDAQGTQHVNYLGNDHHVHELWWNGAWHHNDLTAAAGAPASAGNPIGYVFAAQGTQHVNYRGSDHHVHELWWNGAWHHNDLTAAAGAPATAGEPAGYVFDAQGTQHVNYRGSDSHIHELWWNGTWHHNDLTAAAGAPAAASDPAGYMFKAQGTQHVNYRGSDNHIHELWWNGAWHHNDLTAAAGAPAAASDPSNYMFDAEGTQHVNYRGTDNHVHELWWG